MSVELEGATREGAGGGDRNICRVTEIPEDVRSLRVVPLHFHLHNISRNDPGYIFQRHPLVNVRGFIA